MFKRIVTIFALLIRPSNGNFCHRNDHLSTTLSTMTTFEDVQKVRGRSDDHLNNALFSQVPQATGTVIYFGGDVQNLSEQMLAHRDHNRYVEWSLENVGSILRKAFPAKNILIIRPARFERATFSCFDNFVESNWCGAPTHTDNPNKLEALPQLRGILKSLQERDTDGCEQINESLIDSKKILIGFSKGVVVLNQILHEISVLQDFTTDGSLEIGSSGDEDKTSLASFSRSISVMSWLDGGHNGGKETWITSQKILKSLVTHGTKVDVRVTPYQISDDRRPWIGKEEKKFSSFLAREMEKEKFRRKVYFENEEICIDNHFSILGTFETNDPFFD